MATSTRDVNIRLIATMSIVTGILLIAITFALQAWFAWETNRALESKLERADDTALTQLRREQEATWVTAETRITDEKGLEILKVPLARAKQMVVEQAQAQRAEASATPE